MCQEHSAMVQKRLSLDWRLCITLAFTLVLSSGLLSAQDQQERDRLADRIERLIEQERRASIIDYADSRTFAGELKSAESDVKNYHERVERLEAAKRDGLRLNGTRVN